MAGVGTASAARAAEALVAEGATTLLSWGTAGALTASLPAGTLLLYARCRDPLQGTWYATHAPLRSSLRSALSSLCPHECAALTHATPLPTRAQKNAAFVDSGCEAVDMETSAVAAVAHAHDLPFLAVRAVVDPADFSLPASALAGMAADGGLVKVLAALARRPGELGALLRLAWWYRRALVTLRAAAGLIEAASWEPERGDR
ncbi:MAG: nucleosidase [Gammaproteobacteria bacterium]